MGECQDIPSKFLCLTVPKNFGGHLFSVSLIWGIEKHCASQGYVTIFLRNFVPQYRKTLQGNTSVLCFGKFPVTNKFMDKKGGMSRIFRRKNFVSQFRETP